MAIKGINNNRIDSVFKESSVINKLGSGQKLIIKSGIDPTSTDIHLGHLVGLLALRDLQKLGHKIVFVLGDFTAQLGDGITRPKLSLKQTSENAVKLEKFLRNFFIGGDFELHKQSEWFKKMSVEEFIGLLSEVSVRRLLSHDTFAHKLDQNSQLQTHEITYPLFMAFDSIILQPDIEVGSLEQKFNFQLTRLLMKKHGLEPEDFILNARLQGIDGSEKMSKSQNNFIGIFENIDVQIAKILKISDDVAGNFLQLLTDIPEAEVTAVVKSKDWLEIRNTIVVKVLGLFHPIKKINSAWNKAITQDNFQKVQFNKVSHLNIQDFLIQFGKISSNRELKRMIENKAIKVNNKQIIAADLKRIRLERNQTFQIGKKLHFRIE